MESCDINTCWCTVLGSPSPPLPPKQLLSSHHQTMWHGFYVFLPFKGSVTEWIVESCDINTCWCTVFGRPSPPPKQLLSSHHQTMWHGFYMFLLFKGSVTEWIVESCDINTCWCTVLGSPRPPLPPSNYSPPTTRLCDMVSVCFYPLKEVLQNELWNPVT